eukprot:s3490_g5.t1
MAFLRRKNGWRRNLCKSWRCEFPTWRSTRSQASHALLTLLHIFNDIDAFEAVLDDNPIFTAWEEQVTDLFAALNSRHAKGESLKIMEP